MESREYLRLLGIPGYMRGEMDFSLLLAGEERRGAAAGQAASGAPAPRGYNRGRSGEPPQRSANRQGSARPAVGSRKNRPRAPELPQRQSRGAAPAAPARSAPDVKAPASPLTRYRPDLATLARKGAPILEDWRSEDNAFSKDELKQWTALGEEVTKCQRCPLHESRQNTVFGDGSLAPRLVLVGEGPGADEDYSGLPFVGRSGRLLTWMIDTMGFRREQVFICNVVKCRPPKNRKPEPSEAEACADYLDRQLALLRPQVILALGAVAATRLLHVDSPVGKLRGRRHEYKVGDLAIPVFVSYHPSFLLRQASQKAQAWEDIKVVLRFLTGR